MACQDTAITVTPSGGQVVFKPTEDAGEVAFFDPDGDLLTGFDWWIEKIVATDDSETAYGRTNPFSRPNWVSVTWDQWLDGGVRKGHPIFTITLDDVPDNTDHIEFGVAISDGTNPEVTAGFCFYPVGSEPEVVFASIYTGDNSNTRISSFSIDGQSVNNSSAAFSENPTVIRIDLVEEKVLAGFLDGKIFELPLDLSSQTEVAAMSGRVQGLEIDYDAGKAFVCSEIDDAIFSFDYPGWTNQTQLVAVSEVIDFKAAIRIGIDRTAQKIYYIPERNASGGNINRINYDGSGDEQAIGGTEYVAVHLFEHESKYWILVSRYDGGVFLMDPEDIETSPQTAWDNRICICPGTESEAYDFAVDTSADPVRLFACPIDAAEAAISRVDDIFSGPCGGWTAHIDSVVTTTVALGI